MARPSPLAPKQWHEIEKRLLNGEKANRLAKEFGITEGAIRKRFSAKVRTIKEVANQVLEAEKAFNNLDVSTQVSTQNLINELRAVSVHVTGAAKYGAMTSHHLAKLAHAKALTVDERNLDDSGETLQVVSGLTAISNNAAKNAIDLIRSQKDSMEHTEDKSTPTRIERVIVNSINRNASGI